MSARAPSVLVVAGSDSSGGAGIARDVETLTLHGVSACLAVTAVTVQTNTGVARVDLSLADLVEAQMRAALAAGTVRAIKIGMLGSGEIVRAVATVLADHPGQPAVLDPVLASSSGHPLLDAGAIGLLCTELMPRTALVTPNLPELALLAGAVARARRPSLQAEEGSPERAVPSPVVQGGDRRAHDSERGANHGPSDLSDMAAILLSTSRAPALLVKGGHGGGAFSVDILFRRGHDPLPFTAPRHAGSLRGTGCMLASAIAANLATGRSLADAIAGAKAHIESRFAL